MVILPYLHAAYLAADGLGQLVHELNDTRIFVGGGHLLHMVLQFLDQRVARLVLIGFGEDDGGLHDLASYLVGHAGDGTFHHGGVGHQGAFHFERADAVAGTLDDVVGTAHEPQVAVFVLPGHVARVVDAVVPGLAGALRVAVVFLEEAEGFALAGADDDLALLAGFDGAALVVDEVHVILRIGQAHAAGLGLHPGHGGHGQGGLGLSEAFHQLDARQFLEGLEHGGVQRLAGDGAVLQVAEVELRQVFVDEEAEDGGRRAERRDVVVLYHLQDMRRGELLVVVDEDRGAGYPLSVQLAPDGFAPAGIGDGEVQAVLVQVVPEAARDDVSEGVGEVVCHHLGLARGAAGEVHQRDVVVGIGVFGLDEGGGVFEALVEVLVAFGHLGAYADQGLHAGRLGHGGGDVVGDDRLAGADYHLDVCGLAAVDDVLLRQQVGGGDDRRAQLVEGDDAEPEFVAAFQDEHHHVPAADAEALEVGGGAVGLALHVGEGEAAALALVVGPEQGQFVGLFGGPGVYDVIAEVEVFRHTDVQVLDEIFLRCKCGLSQKSFYHNIIIMKN